MPGLESILNYMNENFFCKDDPAINEHHSHITKNRYNKETHNVYNIDKTQKYDIENNRYTDEHYYNKEQTVNKNMTDKIGNKHYLIMDMY